MYAPVHVRIFFIAAILGAFCRADISNPAIGNPVSIFEHTMQWRYEPLPSGRESRVLILHNINQLQYIIKTRNVPLVCRFSRDWSGNDGLGEVADRFTDAVCVCSARLDAQPEFAQFAAALLIKIVQATQGNATQKKQHEFARRAVHEITRSNESKKSFIMVGIFMPDGDLLIPVHEVWNKEAYERIVTDVLAYKAISFPYIRIQFNGKNQSQTSSKGDQEEQSPRKHDSQTSYSWWQKIKQFLGIM